MTLKKNNIISEVDRERFNFSKLKQFSKEKIDLKNLTKRFTREKN